MIPEQIVKQIFNYTSPATLTDVTTSFVFDVNSQFAVTLNGISIASVITSDYTLNKVIFTPALNIIANDVLIVALNSTVVRIDFIEPSNIKKAELNSQLNEFTLLAQQIQTDIGNVIKYDDNLQPTREDLILPIAVNNKLIYKNSTGQLALLDYTESPEIIALRNNPIDKKVIVTNPDVLDSSSAGAIIIFNTDKTCNLSNGSFIYQYYHIVQNCPKITFTGAFTFNNIRYGRTEYYITWNGTTWVIDSQPVYVFAYGNMITTNAGLPIKADGVIDPLELLTTNLTQTTFKAPFTGNLIVSFSTNITNSIVLPSNNITITNTTTATSQVFPFTNIPSDLTGLAHFAVSKDDIFNITISLSASEFKFKYYYLPLGAY